MKTLLNNFTPETIFLCGIGLVITLLSVVIITNKFGSKFYNKLNSSK